MFLLFLGVNVVLIGVAVVAAMLLRVRRSGAFVLAAFVAYLSLIVLILTALGAMGKLTLGNYVAAVVVLAVGVVLAAGRFVWPATVATIRRAAQPHRPVNIWRAALGLSTVAILGVWAIRLGSSPIWDYDAIAYHLPFTAKFLQTGSIIAPYFGPLSGPIGYYPANLEMLSAHVLAFGLPDAYLNAVNIIFAVFLVVALWLIGRELAVPRAVSALTALAFVTVPVMFRQIGTTKVDIPFTFLFAALIFFLIRYLKRQYLSDLVFFSAAAGLFIGMRYLGVPYLILPALALFASLIVQFARSTTRRQALVHLAVGLMILVALGGFWYIRNFALTGNPVFPTPVRLGGFTLFEGLRSDFGAELSSLSLLAQAGQLNKTMLVREFFNETGVLFAALAVFLPMLLIAFGLSWRDQRLERRVLFGSLLVAVPIYFFFYVASPFTAIHFHQNIRYALPALFIGTLAVMATVRAAAPSRLLKWYAAAVLAAAIFFNLRLLWVYPQPTFILGATPGAAHGHGEEFYRRLNTYYGGSTPALNAMTWADEHLPAQAKVAYGGFDFHYPLYGPASRREVDYVITRPCVRCNFHDLKSVGGNIFAEPSQTAWLENLRQYGKEYYVFFNQFHYAEPEENWLKQMPNRFELLYDREGAYIYRIMSNG